VTTILNVLLECAGWVGALLVLFIVGSAGAEAIIRMVRRIR